MRLTFASFASSSGARGDDDPGGPPSHDRRTPLQDTPNSALASQVFDAKMAPLRLFLRGRRGRRDITRRVRHVHVTRARAILGEPCGVVVGKLAALA